MPRRVLLALCACLALIPAACTDPMPTATAAGATHVTTPALPTPGKVLNLGAGSGQNRFRLGLGRPSGHTTISLPTLASGWSAPEFRTIAGPDGLPEVEFRVRMDAKTTSSNTKYPRVELQETNTRSEPYYWDARYGTHTMIGETRWTHLPPVKPWAVGFQIHDSSSDLIRVQTEGTPEALRLVARWTPPGSTVESKATVQETYRLGDRVPWRIETVRGAGRLYLHGAKVLDFPARTGRFQVGMYAQSNHAIDAPSEYASLTLRALRVTHTR